MLPSLAQVERAARTGTLGALIAGLPTKGAPELLRLALQRNRAFLVEEPQLALPLVYRLCWFSESEQATLRSMLRSWSAEWTAMKRGSWLRSLRPPTLPLESPLLEEYRAPAGPYAPWFSTDAVGAAADGHAFGWLRSSGERLSDAEVRTQMPATPSPRYEIDSSRRFGTLALRELRSSEVIQIRAGDDDSLDTLAALDNGDVIAAGWFDAYEGVVLRAAPATGRVVWRVELPRWIDSLTLSPDQSRVVAGAQGSDHVILSSERGEVLARCPTHAGAAALSANNRELAVWSGAVLRVWRVARLPFELARDTGLVSAEFSPNGALLLGGTHLYDGVTGEHLAKLSVESGGYLEGGPADGCTRILDDGVVEAGAMSGVHRWDARGTLLWEDRSRRYWQTHVLRFSSDGGHYAIASDRDGAPVEIRAVVGGALVHSIARKTTRVLAWSPDARTLATVDVEGGLWLTNIDGTERRLGMRESARALAFSWDGALLAVWDGDRAQVWNLADGRIEAERRIGDEARPWTHSLHEWSPFRLMAHGHVGTLRDGVFEVRDASGTALVHIPSTELLVPSSTGNHWAGRTAHYALDQ